VKEKNDHLIKKYLAFQKLGRSYIVRQFIDGDNQNGTPFNQYEWLVTDKNSLSLWSQLIDKIFEMSWLD